MGENTLSVTCPGGGGRIRGGKGERQIRCDTGTASGEGMVSDRAISMLQTINVQGELLTCFMIAVVAIWYARNLRLTN